MSSGMNVKELLIIYASLELSVLCTFQRLNVRSGMLKAQVSETEETYGTCRT